jgi:hypothetical protein
MEMVKEDNCHMLSTKVMVFPRSNMLNSFCNSTHYFYVIKNIDQNYNLPIQFHNFDMFLFDHNFLCPSIGEMVATNWTLM